MPRLKSDYLYLGAKDNLPAIRDFPPLSSSGLNTILYVLWEKEVKRKWNLLIRFQSRCSAQNADIRLWRTKVVMVACEYNATSAKQLYSANVTPKGS